MHLGCPEGTVMDGLFWLQTVEQQCNSEAKECLAVHNHSWDNSMKCDKMFMNLGDILTAQHSTDSWMHMWH